MPESSYTVRDAIFAETAAVEAVIVAERLRAAGAWFSYATASQLAETQRAKADAINASVRQHRMTADAR